MKGKHQGMQDNRMVHSTRQKGIERVIQRKGSMEVGESAKMTGKGSANWSRKGDKLTPRRA